MGNSSCAMLCPRRVGWVLVRLHQMEVKIQKIKIEGKLWLRLMKPTERRKNCVSELCGSKFITRDSGDCGAHE